MLNANPLLLVGELYVDFTTATKSRDCKLRLGGIVHAARGLWALDIKYSVAVICPKYLLDSARRYLLAHGCSEFVWLGEVSGAPNVIVIDDPEEVSHQGYEDLLRDERFVEIFDVSAELKQYSDVLFFPGAYDLKEVRPCFSNTARFSFDIAYGVSTLSALEEYIGQIRAIITSTSSELFLQRAELGNEAFVSDVKCLNPEVYLQKENRGGSQLFDIGSMSVEQLPAVLGETVNSVGVGDVYSATMVGLSSLGWVEAAWRASRSAMYYALTTFPDDLKRDIRRDRKLSVEQLRALGGVVVPWFERSSYPIYLAGPDFTYVRKPEFDAAVDALTYHNFNVRRPVLENGEIKKPATVSVLKEVYQQDLDILNQCSLVFAIPLDRDPGTLVEIGLALQKGVPVVTYDPRKENDNTMVIGGSTFYSSNIEQCLSAVFEIVSGIRASI